MADTELSDAGSRHPPRQHLGGKHRGSAEGATAVGDGPGIDSGPGDEPCAAGRSAKQISLRVNDGQEGAASAASWR